MEQTAYYQINFLYMDGQKLNFQIGKEKLSKYFEKLQNNNLFWFVDQDEFLDNGFWTDINKIRTIHIKAFKGIKHEDEIISEVHCTSESDNTN